MSEGEKSGTIEATQQAIYGQLFTARQMGVELDSYQLARIAIAAHNEELARHPVEVSLSELESAIAIARKREGKHTMDPASEVTEFFVDLGLPIEVIE